MFKQNEDKRILLSIWNEWINYNKLEPEWKNLQVYWHYFGVTEQFLKYLDKNIDGILIKQCPENWDSALTKEVMLSEIVVSCFEKFILAVPKIEDTIDLSKVSKKYLCILIENKYFDFSDRSRRHDEKLYDTEYNRKLVEYLKEIGYISSYISKRELDNSITVQGRNTQILICKIRKGN